MMVPKGAPIMTTIDWGRSYAVVVVALASLLAGHAAESQSAGVPDLVKAFLKADASNAWEAVETLPGTKWAPLPPTELKDCLPTGDCYARQGGAVLGGRNMAVIAAGARTMAASLFIRNTGAPLGEAAVLDSLKKAGLAAELARCPVRQGVGSTNWYRVKGAGVGPGVLSIQTSCAGKPCEGFVLTRGEKLPALKPDQLANYSEQCAAGAPRAAVSTKKPHELLAQTLVTMIPAKSGPALPDWATLLALPTGITWLGTTPKPMDLKILKNDSNPVGLTGSLDHAGRNFAVMASGTPAQVKNVYIDEGGLHPKGEHLLGVIHEKGFQVRLVRCGPVYTESINNWYRVTSERTRPVMIRQSIGYDGSQVADGYALRLDGSLPERDQRDRDPGVHGCQ
jgi:hypothetical protein